jgi:GGDEF domain-containing protein
MISIRRFLDRSDPPADDHDLLAASLRLHELLLSEAAASDRPGHPAGEPDSGPKSDLLHRLENATTPAEVLAIANQAVEAAHHDTRRAVAIGEEQRQQMQSMLAMLTETLADVSGQADTSVAQLQEIEHQVQRASTPDDIRALKENLASCLTAVKESIVQQRKVTMATLERLQNQIQRSPQSATAAPAPAPGTGGAPRAEAEYVAAFRLQRADHILTRFGEAARDQMVTVIGEVLKSIEGPDDRLMRWKGPSFVMLVNSPDHLIFVRRRIAAAVSKIGQRYVELGKNSALLAVGVDWTVFQQARYASLDLVFADVDAFLNETAGKP